MSDKRAARSVARESNPVRIGRFDFSVGDTSALMELLDAAEDNVLSFGPWAIAGKTGIGVAISFNGSTVAVQAWTGIQEVYYFLKDLMVATWERMKGFWQWVLGLFNKDKAIAAKDELTDVVSKAVDAAVEAASAKVAAIKDVVAK